MRSSGADLRLLEEREMRHGRGVFTSTILGLFLLATAVGASFAETSLVLFSEPGDPIGSGHEYAYSDADGTFTVTRNAGNGVSIWLRAAPGDDDWLLDFAGAGNKLLTTGTYANASHYPSTDPLRPGMNVIGNHLACATLTGSFEVLDIVYNAEGGIDRFRARFEQFCQSATHSLTGEIRFHTAVPVHLTVPRSVSVVEGQELRFDVSALAEDGLPVALSVQGLPAEAVLSATGPGAGELRWTPGHDRAGSYVATFFGEDSTGHVEDAPTRVFVGALLHVPADHTTIQGAIDAAPEASVVIVGPGTYRENLDMRGKALTLTSAEGPDATIIDGQRHGPVIRCGDGMRAGTIIRGFTLQGGAASYGAGILIEGSGPTIAGNVFRDNVEYSAGGGAAIGGFYASPLIDGNVFTGNSCDTQGESAVITLEGEGIPIVVNNLILDNPCTGINAAVYGSAGPSVVNNTIVGNRAGIRLDRRLNLSSHLYSNNVLAGNQVGLQVDFEPPAVNPIWKHNLVFGNGVAYLGTADRTGSSGNIAGDPKFLCPARGDYRPTAASAVVDAGDDDAGLTRIDLRGTTRVLDGDGDGTAIVDIGALEFDPSSPGLCLVCPDDMTVLAPHDQVTAVVLYSPVVSEGAAVVCAPASGAVFAEGTTTVTCTAHDATNDTEVCSFGVTVIVPPSNDDFDYATEITDLPFTDRVNTKKATIANDDPPGCGGPESVWYAYTPRHDTVIDVQAGDSSYLVNLAAFTGSRGALTQEACATSQIHLAVRAGERIYVMASRHTAIGPGTLRIKVSGSLCEDRPVDCGLPHLLQPNGGVLAAGSVVPIRWESPRTDVTFDLQYSIDDGARWKPIATDITGNSYSWTVPPQSNSTTKSKVRVIAYNSSHVRAGADVSDAPFTFAVVKVDSPNGHEYLSSATTRTVRWTTYPTTRPVESVSLFLSTTGGATWKTIATVGGNPGLYDWTVQVVGRFRSNCRLRVMLRDVAGKSLGRDESDAAFAIEP